LLCVPITNELKIPLEDIGDLINNVSVDVVIKFCVEVDNGSCNMDGDGLPPEEKDKLLKTYPQYADKIK